MTAGRLFRIEEAAALRGESYGATRAAIARGELRAVRVGVRGVRIPESELLKSGPADGVATESGGVKPDGVAGADGAYLRELGPKEPGAK